jgi:MarR family transcriptional regulator, organic hydroperoxide resistance regulator
MSLRFVNNVSTRYYLIMSVITKTVHDIIERLGNLVRADVRALCHAQGVRPVQFEALRYLLQCNRYSDTPQAVTEFLGLTKGTVSQTLTVLEQKGLLVKRNDKGDKRVVHLKPTIKGRRLIEQVIPSQTVASGIESLSVSEQLEMVEALQHLLRSIQKTNGLKTFASCHTCRFNNKRDGHFFCELTQEALSDDEVTLLCREHQYPATGTSC